MKPKTKRLITLSSSLFLFGVGCIILFYNLRGNLVFFYSPTELLEKSDINSQKVRLGGMVKKESIFKEMVLEDNFKIQKITFVITDFKNDLKDFNTLNFFYKWRELSEISTISNIIVNEIGQNGFINQINLFKSNILQKDNDNLIVSTQSNDLKKFNLLLDKYETFKDLLRKMLDEC